MAARGKAELYCSSECRPAKNRWAAIGGKPTWIATCAWCAEPFTTNREARRFCSPECGLAAHHRQPKPLRNGIPRGARRLAIFERDGWRCYLCRRAIDRDLRHPHPLSASIDHVVPVTAGGSHRDDNLRATHLSCNDAKGDRLLDELWTPRLAESIA